MVKKLSWLLVFVLILSVGCFAAKRAKATDIKDEVVGQAVLKVGSNVEIPAGEIVQCVVSVGGDVVVSGKVVEDAVSIGGSVTLKDGAEVGGDVVAVGGQVIKEGSSAAKGSNVEVNMPALVPVINFLSADNLLIASIILSILNTIGFIILAILLVAFFTPQIGKASALIEKKFWTTFWWGILTPILFVIVAVGLVFSIIGILLLPLAFLILIAACVFGYVAAAHLCGKKLLIAMRLRGKPMMAEVIVGLVLLWLISMIPMIGGVINAVVGLCGFGATAVSRFGTK